MVESVARAFAGKGSLSYRQGATLILIAGTLFSFTALLFRAVESATDWQFLMLRGSSTVLVLLLVAFMRRTGRAIRPGDLTWRAVLAGVILACMSMLFILALARTTAAMVTFLLAAAPISGALFGRLFLRESISVPTALAILTTVGGVALMVSSGIEAGDTSGVVLAAIIPLGFGLYNVLIRSSGEALDPIVPAIVQGLVLTVVCGGVVLAGPGFGLGLRDVVLGCVSGGLVLGIGLPLFNLGHRSVPTAQVSLLNLTEVVLTPLWVWIWPGEIPTAGTLVGGAIVIFAVVYLVLASDRAFRLAPP
jgi:drug/metabolite transporter (DMT)-like permease